MNLHSRLRTLERATVATRGERCARCGHFLDGRRLPPGSVPIKVHFGSFGEPEPDLGPEACPECGTQLIFRLDFDRGAG